MRPFKDQCGVALPLALFLLAGLTGLLVVFVSMGGTDPAISANLNDTTRARYAADAGIEWAFDQLVQQTALDPMSNFKAVVTAILNNNGGVMATNMSLPGLTPTFGAFSVTARNDNLANDDKITGQPVDLLGGSNTDTNDVVILTATGTFNGVTRQIQQVVMHVDMNIPGGLNLPGLGTNTAFSGNAFTINGNDTNVDDTAGSCGQVWGIGVADAGMEAAVEASLSAPQKNNVTGKQGWGDPTISPDPTLTPAQIAKFVNAVKPYADMTLQASGANRLDYQNIGDTCSANLGDPNCWGTRANPKIVYVKGSLDPAQAFYALSLSGDSTGAGILIVEDGDLNITGNFRWEGLVVVTGQYTGLRYGGGGNQTIYGGVVVNETAAVNSELEVDGMGNAKVLYSCQAVNNVRNMRRLFRLASWREL